LFDGDELSEGGGDELDDCTGEEVPGDADERTFPPKNCGESSGEEDDVEDGLGEVGVEVGERGGPLLDVGGESLVGVADSGVEIGELCMRARGRGLPCRRSFP
jgi:hypothetical protein